MESVLEEIRKERKRQNKKWGEQNHEPFTYLAILGEEVGEANQAAIEAHNFGKNDKPVWDDKKLTLYREELVQVAAVAVAMIECYDRNKPKKKKTCPYPGCSDPFRNRPPCALCYE